MRTIKHIIYKYNNLSIRIKITISILLAALIPAVTIASMFSSRLYDMIISDTIRSEQQETITIAPQIADTLNTITSYTSDICSQQYYHDLFLSSPTQPYSSMANTTEAYEFATYIKNFVKSSKLSAVRIYCDLPETDFNFFEQESSENLFLPISVIKGTYWYGIMKSQNSSSLYCPSMYLGTQERATYADCAYIYRTPIIINGETHYIYLVLYYSSKVYSQILTDAITINDSVSFIINERDSIVSTTNASLSGMYFINYSNLKDSLMSSNNFIEKDVAGNRVYIAMYYIKAADWFMVTVIPRDPLIDIGNDVAKLFLLISLFSIFIAIIISLFQSRSIIHRLHNLTSQMSKVRSEYPKPLPAPRSQDEVGELITTYNYMTNRMDELTRKQQQTAEDLRMSEFNALQAQINPHFLYNMMDVINWMVLQNKPEEASTVIQQLAYFYRLTLSHKKNIGTIKEEFEHVNIYTALQNLRFPSSIDFVIDMPDELTRYQIPKLTLQPIVENSILHGILEKPTKKGTIVITGWEENDDIYILVSDDGIGIPADILSRILTVNSHTSSRGSNIAIYNIHNRLQLLYGKKYGLSYESTEGVGCEVTITIPKRTLE